VGGLVQATAVKAQIRTQVTRQGQTLDLLRGAHGLDFVLDRRTQLGFAAAKKMESRHLISP
jgi:hypothetical protein